MEPIIAPTQAPPDAVKDSDTASFAQDVLLASRETPVIVDLWAPWCGPCKTLGPMLEKIVKDSAGAVKLVKINIDENQQLAQQLRVQSIPAVFAFVDGQPVDGFVGALPESQLKQFVQRLTGDQGPSQIEQALEVAKQALESGELDQALGIYGQIVRAEPGNPAALAGMAQCYLQNGDVEQATQALDGVAEADRKHADVVSAQAAIDLAGQAGDAGEIGPLRAAVAANAGDHQARFDLAMALVGQGHREEAVDALLEIVRRDRQWNDEAARKQLLTLFEAFGPTDELTVSARRRLSSILFS